MSSTWSEVEVGDIIEVSAVVNVRIMTLDRGDHAAQWSGVVVEAPTERRGESGNRVPVDIVSKTRGADSTEGNRRDAMVFADLLDDIEVLAVRADRLAALTESNYVRVNTNSLRTELRAVVEPFTDD